MIQMILSRSSLCVKHDTDDTVAVVSLCVKHDTDDTVAVALKKRPGTDNWSTYGSSFLDTDRDLHSPSPPGPPPPPVTREAGV